MDGSLRGQAAHPSQSAIPRRYVDENSDENLRPRRRVLKRWAMSQWMIRARSATVVFDPLRALPISINCAILSPPSYNIDNERLPCFASAVIAVLRVQSGVGSR